MGKFQDIHIQWNWQLNSSPEKLWDVISDTNRLFKAINLPAVQYADISYDNKDRYLQLSYDSIKYSDAWIEEPYQWEYPYRFGVKRFYRNGSYKEVKLQVDLLPHKNGTRLNYQLWITPGNALFSYFSILRLKTATRGRLRNYFKKCDDLIGKQRPLYALESGKRLVSGANKRIEEIAGAIRHKTGSNKIVHKLIDFIRKADEIDLHHINSRKMATTWNAKPKEVLHVFLHAVKEGLLNFNWTLHCPYCRTVQEVCKTLSEIHEPVYCQDCKSEFRVNFNRSVQLSFQPNPLIRKISDKQYAVEGPQKRPHVVIQQLLKPDQSRYLRTKLDGGTYHLHCSKSKGKAVLHVGPEGDDTVNIRLTEIGLHGEVDILNEPNLTFINDTGQEQIFTLQKVEWDEEILTAAEVTSLQIFRDLFSNEVLRKGEKIAVDQLTLMFTDLFDSTAMYHKEGDNQAVSRVIEHFDILQQAVTQEDGALVKTIGDSIMAVFSKPSQALRAFVNAQQIISKDKRFKNSLKLKAGIHHGSCVAVNLDNKIDYFGSTVNITSRLVDCADENELVISESVSGDEEIGRLLQGKLQHNPAQKEKVKLKGFESEMFVLHRINMKQTPLRLVI